MPQTTSERERIDRVLAHAPEAIDELVDGLEQEHARAVRELLRELSPADRELLEIKFWSSTPTLVIAQRLGIEPSALHQQVHRALRRLERRARERFPDLFVAQAERPVRAPGTAPPGFHVRSDELVAAAESGTLGDRAGQHVEGCWRCRARLESAREVWSSVGRYLARRTVAPCPPPQDP